ncbi:hypothetical protein [Bullifex sp.]|uniref:hypothetical protein n=1 Tax=Bullifex sp. TaxID=2815808 RepID=UPI002A815931|nr:hypothetical protein [Bullifex sp.]MDY4067667.1 hypothetical protein [Bullifex sp.]
MAERKTSELKSILKSSRVEDWEEFSNNYSNTLNWREYFLSLLDEKGVSKSDCIKRSNLEIHYAYQIISAGRNPSRDKIIALCVGGRFSNDETDRCLEKAGYQPLYPKNPRDALIACAENSGIDSVVKLNILLSEKSFLPLE